MSSLHAIVQMRLPTMAGAMRTFLIYPYLGRGSYAVAEKMMASAIHSF